MTQPSFWNDPEFKIKQEIPLVSQASDGTTIESWVGGVHPDGFLEFSKGFYLYADKLSRMLVYLEQQRNENERLYGQLSGITGLSESRVEALVQYAVYMQLLVQRTLFPTPLCRLVLNKDTFFDHNGTLWLLHYLLASNPQLVVWNYMCNAVIPSVSEIQKSEAADQFLAFSGRWTKASLQKKTRKELRAFFAVYSEEMFAPLVYLREVKPLVYSPTRDVIPVPEHILLATALIYRDRFHPGASGVEIPTLVYADNSPGRLMRQREADIRKTLDELHEAGLLTIESKANLDQIRFKSSITWLDAVRQYYQNFNS